MHIDCVPYKALLKRSVTWRDSNFFIDMAPARRFPIKR